MTIKLERVCLSLWCAMLIAFANPVFADDIADAVADAESINSVEQELMNESEQQAAERRKKILQEAVDALERSKEALAALEEERVDDALEALAVTTGKLELIVARDPKLALAPTDVSIRTHDLYASPEAIEKAIQRADDALDEGKIQVARHILDGLGSELVITVGNLPLATYPDAIKAITPLIDAGDIDEARTALQAALNTLVLTEQIVPLPVLRSEALLEQAEALASNGERTAEETGELGEHLAAVHKQLEMAELLGYGERDDYKPLYKQLKDLEARVNDGRFADDHLDSLRSSLSQLWNSIIS